jgi:REP element-mobilizing transposase RayT
MGIAAQLRQAPEGRKSLGNTSTNLIVHMIFGTKQRRPMIQPWLQARLHTYMGGIIREIGGIALRINGATDHVHLLVKVPAVCSVADLARVVKTNSSKWVHEQWQEHGDFAWQSGYAAFSVSASNVAAVTEYIAGQEEHHRKREFREEFVAFLRKNGFSGDERYLWD